MVRKEYNSLEYYVQGFRNAMKNFGKETGIDFSERQSGNIVSFRFKNKMYSVEFLSSRKPKSVELLLERFVLSDDPGNNWYEITRLNVKPKRSKAGKVSEDYYKSFIKQEILRRLVNGE
tara:strand:- start:505 stop:861 length:357 start_codon:yes stop_codon:yes gene_type:complete